MKEIIKELQKLFSNDLATYKRLLVMEQQGFKLETMVEFVYKKRTSSRKIKEFKKKYDIFISDDEKIKIYEYLEIDHRPFSKSKVNTKPLTTKEKLQFKHDEAEKDAGIDLNIIYDENGEPEKKFYEYKFNPNNKQPNRVVKLAQKFEPSTEQVNNWIQDFLEKNNFKNIPKYAGKTPLNIEAELQVQNKALNKKEIKDEN